MSEPNILIVDDEPEILDILEHMLADYPVMRALNVSEALAILERESCAVVVTDLRMPGASGEVLISHVKQSCPSTSVIVITGHGRTDSAGADLVFRWIAKPFRRATIVQAVQEALEFRRNSAALHPTSE